MRIVLRLSVAAAAVLICRNAESDDLQFSADDSETVRLTTHLVLARHFENQPIDDGVAAALVDAFVNVWDPAKLFFRKTDIEQFNAYRNVVDDNLRAGKLDFPAAVFRRYLLRLAESAAFSGPAIDVDHDFADEESIPADFDDRDWCDTDAAMRERWRQTAKSMLLTMKLDGDSLQEARTKLHRRFQSQRDLATQTTSSEVLEAYLTAMLRCLDPHSGFMAPRSRAEFDIAMKLQLQGIGARLKFEDGDTVVVEVVAGGAAAVDGRLTKDDRIIAVGEGSDGEFVDVVGTKLSRVVDRIRGPAGTTVRLKVKKPTGETVTCSLTRQVISLDDQEASGIVLQSRAWLPESDVTIGVLHIPWFYRDFQGAATGGTFKSTAQDVRRILRSFREQEVDALIVDLRFNSGGSLSEAVEVGGLFIPQGPIVQTRTRQARGEILADEDKRMQWSGPMVVVCNRLSASAAEIFAGAMQDYRRAVIVGDSQTHGKGTVQNIMHVQNGLGLLSRDRGDLKLTIGMWYRVNGDSGQIRGVVPHVTLPSLVSVVQKGEDSLEHAIPFHHIDAVEYSEFKRFLPEGLAESLKAQSRQRIMSDDSWKTLDNQIKAFQKAQAAAVVSLNEADRRRLKEERNRDPESQGKERESETKFPHTFYNKEVVQIVHDYLRLLKGA